MPDLLTYSQSAFQQNPLVTGEHIKVLEALVWVKDANAESRKRSSERDFNGVFLPSNKHVSYYLRSEEMHENVEREGCVEI